MHQPRPLRSDAARRRDAVLDAAVAIFGDQGIDAPLDLVAERAGVGRATLYRSFPDREALLIAVLSRELEALEHLSASLGDRPDRVFDLLGALAEQLVRTSAVAEAMRRARVDPAALASIHARLGEVFAAPMAEAQAAGRLRPDLTPQDAVLIVRMLGGALGGAASPLATPARTLDLLVAGLRGAAHG